MFVEPNLINNFFLLKQEFTGVSIHFAGVLKFIFTLIILSVVFILMHEVGERIRKKIFQINLEERFLPLIDIGLGYIIIGSGIALLGVFSSLNGKTMSILGFLLVLFFLPQFKFVKVRIFAKKPSPLIIGIIFFILLSFLRLIIPETNVDALWYHTDLPRIYSQFETTMISPNYQLHLITIPQLAEMYYVISEMIGIRELSRFIHFTFYVLIVIALYIYFDKKKLGIYTTSLFVSAPVVIRHASSALSNFQWVFCWMLMIIVLTKVKKITLKTLFLAGFFFGGVLATKIWTFGFYPFVIGYVYLVTRKQFNLKGTIIFAISSLIPASLWYIRSYILSGNPFYPAFAHDEYFFPRIPGIESYLSWDAIKFRIESVFNFSPLIIIPAYSFLFKKNRNILKDHYLLGIFFVCISIAYIFLPYFFGHYLYAWYIPAVLIFSIGLSYITGFQTKIFSFAFLMLIVYYFIQTFFLLPYGFSWADQNKYLTRILGRDNSSYFDYDHRFSSHIKKNDVVATYGLWGFYYANFNPVFVQDIFKNKKVRTLGSLKEKHIQLLLIKGGTIDWFCKELSIIDCKRETQLLAKYEFVYTPASQYLYMLK